MADVVSRLVITALDQTAAAFKSVEQRSEKLADGFVSASKKIATTGAVAVATISALAVKGSQAAEELLRMSQAFNIPPDRLLNLQTAAELTSTSIETIGKASLRVGGVVQDALIGKSTDAVAALRALGIAQEDLTAVQNDTEGQLRLVSERFQDLEPGIQRTRLAAEIFGDKLATQMVPFLLEGNQAMQQAGQDLAALGIELTSLDVIRAEELGDQFDRAKGVLRAVSIEIASFAGPRVKTLLDLFLDSSKAANDMGDEGLSAGQKIDAAIAASLDTGQTLIKLFLATKARLIELALGASEFNVRLGEAAQSAVRLATFGQKTDAFGENLAEARAQTEELRASFLRADAAAIAAFSRGSAGEAYLDRLEQNLRDGAEALKKFNAESGRPVGPTGGGDSDKKDKELEKFRQRIDTIIESTQTEREVLEQAFSDNLILLQDAQSRDLITREQFAAVKLRLEDKFQEALAAIKEKENASGDRLRQQLDDRLKQLQAQQGSEVEQRRTAFEQELADFDKQFADKLGKEDAYLTARNLLIQTRNAEIKALEDEARIEADKKEAEAREKKLKQLEEISGIQQQTLSDLFNFQDLGFAQQLGALTSFGAAFTGALSGHSKKAFEIHKKFAIAEAIISTLKGIDIALGSAPPPLNFALAAAVAAKGFATVAQIKSTQPGGSAGGSGGGGAVGSSSLGGGINGSSVSAPNEEQGGPTTLTLNLNGAKTFNREDIEQIIIGMNELAADRANINFEVV